eukprot:CAMPEP_0119370910 /NCGR_PEP_ID=MMETSP1334-20130426/17188_1 /TAXON_ID=127549 /ORGANISM="Calcidiscus leptoporus, Strain RCC1130" /LENGTH=80 /DNA_ID=CAMNT_0007388073 /DNA_START=279 /DNA_END=518 /DNA_ORIENTATION=+
MWGGGDEREDVASARNQPLHAQPRSVAGDDDFADVAHHPVVLGEVVVPVGDVVLHPRDIHHVHVERRRPVRREERLGVQP